MGFFLGFWNFIQLRCVLNIHSNFHVHSIVKAETSFNSNIVLLLTWVTCWIIGFEKSWFLKLQHSTIVNFQILLLTPFETLVMKIFGCRIAAAGEVSGLFVQFCHCYIILSASDMATTTSMSVNFNNWGAGQTIFCFSCVGDCDHNSLHPCGENMIIQSIEHDRKVP